MLGILYYKYIVAYKNISKTWIKKFWMHEQSLPQDSVTINLEEKVGLNNKQSVTFQIDTFMISLHPVNKYGTLFFGLYVRQWA